MTTKEPEQTQAAWNKIAEGYDKIVTPNNMSLGSEALERAGLAKGMRFLDVACGSGALSIPAARIGARVTSTDISPVMVELVTARARKDGLSNLEAIVMDGQDLRLEDDTFDVSGSQYGVMLFPDLPRGLSEMVRVTKPRGRVVLIAFGPPQEVEFLGFMIGAIKAVVPGFSGLPMDPPPLPFQVADPDKLRQALTNAGLKDVHVERVTQKHEFENGQELWDWLMNSNPIPGMLVADLTVQQKTEVRRALDRMVHERSGGSGPAVLSNPVHIGIGIK